MPRNRPEAAVQAAIVDYLRSVLPPDNIVHHCRNEINKRGAAFAIEIAGAKRLGAMAGFPDLIVLPRANIGPVFLEVKAPGGYPTKTQKEMHARLAQLGYRVAVVRSIDDTRAALAQWGIYANERTQHGISE